MKSTLGIQKGIVYTVLMLLLIGNTPLLFGQPGTYYNSVDPSVSTFVNDLKSRIRSPYTDRGYEHMRSTFDTFDARDTLQNKKVITCVYTNFHHVYTPPLTFTTINREHTFPQSWGAVASPATSDKHHIFPTEAGANSSRGNKPFGYTTTPSTYNITRTQHRGDAARALMYISLQYHGVISGYSWLLPSYGQDMNVLMDWHKQDPPDKREMERNNHIQGTQQNRNPFIDNPEWVKFINFTDLSKLSPVFAAGPSNNPTGFNAVASNNSVTLNWTDAVAGAQTPSGYLIQAFNYDQYFLPIDGEVYPDDTDPNDGYAVVNIAYDGSDTYTFAGLTEGKAYYFTIISYNGEGALRNYNSRYPLVQTNATTGGSSQTSVSFYLSVAEVLENAGTYNAELTITNPNPTSATTCQVALLSGSTLDVGGFTSQNVTFPAGSATSQIVPITILNDTNQTGNKTVVFEIRNVTGGTNAMIGNRPTLTLTIQDLQTLGTDLIINEFSQGPSGAKEWIELLVISDETNLQGWKVTDSNGSLSLTLAGSGFGNLAEGSIIVLYNGGDLDPLITPDLTYDGVTDKRLVVSSLNNSGVYAITRTNGWIGTTGAFGNTTASDIPRLFNALGVEVFFVPIPVPAATTGYFKGNSTSGAKVATNWETSAASSATPGALNPGQGTTSVSIDDNFNERSHAGRIQEIFFPANVPNPFNPATQLQFSVGATQFVRLSVTDVRGVEVARLFEGSAERGRTHTVSFNASKMPSGIYFARLSGSGWTRVNKMLLMK